jgi:peptidoglycan lytic transglycosylase
VGKARFHHLPIRTLLITAGVAVAVLTVWALAAAGGPDGGSPPPAAAPTASAPPTPAKTATKKPADKAAPSTAKAEAAVKARPSYKVIDSGRCEASYYWEGQMTASGERFDPSELTAAHKTLPMDSRVRVVNANNGKSVVVRINDRGPYIGGRCLDLSKAAMVEVGGTGSGVIPVKYQVLVKT